jgi:hypothetical protein
MKTELNYWLIEGDITWFCRPRKIKKEFGEVPEKYFAMDAGIEGVYEREGREIEVVGTLHTFGEIETEEPLTKDTLSEILSEFRELEIEKSLKKDALSKSLSEDVLKNKKMLFVSRQFKEQFERLANTAGYMPIYKIRFADEHKVDDSTCSYFKTLFTAMVDEVYETRWKKSPKVQKQ